MKRNSILLTALLVIVVAALLVYGVFSASGSQTSAPPDLSGEWSTAGGSASDDESSGQTSAPSEPEEQEPEFPAYQLEGLETLTEAGVINSPEFWRQKFSEQVTVGEMFGILGKLFTKVTE